MRGSGLRSSRLLLSFLCAVASGCTAGEVVPCSYEAAATKSHPTPEEQQLQPRGRCATRGGDGSLTVHADHLDELRFRDGLAAIFVSDGWYYVTPGGRTVPVLTFDNGPDDFVEGFARTRRSGKVGYVDRRLLELIAPAWDFALPFRDGVALVCEGCETHPTGDGEHIELRGGLWGYIDREGTVVVPVRYERDEVPVPEARG